MRKSVIGVLVSLLLVFAAMAVGSAIISAIAAASGAAGAALAQQPDWVPTVCTQAGFLLVALAAMLIIGRGRLGRFGFRLPGKRGLWTAIFVGAAVGVCLNGLGWFVERFTPPDTSGFGEMSFLELLLLVWVVASTVEEIFFRGLIQGYLELYSDRERALLGLRLTFPILVGAIS